MGKWESPEETLTAFRTRQTEALRRYRARNLEKVREGNRLHAQRRRAEDPHHLNEVARKSSWKRLHGLTPREYNSMFLDRSGCCDICYLPAEKPLHLDHDHITGRIRGLLCSSCNLRLGWYEHFSESVQNYLK